MKKSDAIFLLSLTGGGLVASAGAFALWFPLGVAVALVALFAVGFTLYAFLSN